MPARRLGLTLVLLSIPAAFPLLSQEAGVLGVVPSADDLRLLNVEVRAEALDGRSALRVAGDPEVLGAIAAERREVMAALRARGERPGPAAFDRRNHSAQYIPHPHWTWFRLREETPGQYETYVDIGPAEWIAVKIEVTGEKARLYVNGAVQPTLIVNDLKSGADGRGKVALWMEGSTVAHFRNLRISPAE